LIIKPIVSPALNLLWTGSPIMLMAKNTSNIQNNTFHPFMTCSDA